MQTQQRAEGGIKEIVIGYVGDEIDSTEEIPNELQTMIASGEAVEVALADLPQDLREIIEVENHRKLTGEVLSVEAYRLRKAGEQK